MSDEQKEFLKSELWILAFGGALQRSGVYKSTLEKERNAFRAGMRKYIEEQVIPKYERNNLTDEDHLQNLEAVIKESSRYKSILFAGAINLGIAQKLLNLILKYYWTLGWIKEPPHFPIDRIIQSKLPAKARTTWTRMTTAEQYMAVIEAARAKAGDLSLPEWELNNFIRRTS